MDVLEASRGNVAGALDHEHSVHATLELHQHTLEHLRGPIEELLSELPVSWCGWQVSQQGLPACQWGAPF